jgi:hypothetical protein
VPVVAIDMCPAYRAAVREHLPDAALVVDHFHVVQLSTRRSPSYAAAPPPPYAGGAYAPPTPSTASADGYYATAKTSPTSSWPTCGTGSSTSAGPASEILAAWIAKENLRDLLALARTQPLRHEISGRLYAFYQWCADTRIPELHRHAGSSETWWPQIEAFLHTGVTNAASEGINRLIKLGARNAHGFRNTTNKRLRSRCATSRKASRQTQPA